MPAANSENMRVNVQEVPVHGMVTTNFPDRCEGGSSYGKQYRTQTLCCDRCVRLLADRITQLLKEGFICLRTIDHKTGCDCLNMQGVTGSLSHHAGKKKKHTLNAISQRDQVVAQMEQPGSKRLMR